MSNQTRMDSAEEAPVPSGAVEAARRVFLVGGVLGALWTGFIYTPVLYCVREQDFEKDKARKSSRPFGEYYAEKSLDAFIADETKDRLIRVEGEKWKKFFDSVETANAGGGGPEWDKRFGSSYAENNLYFRPDEKPLDELSNKLSEEDVFFYLLLQDSDRTRYLSVAYVHSTDLHIAPWAVSRPLRAWSPAFLLVGLLAYIFLPWPRHPASAIRYSLIRGGILPDIVGVGVAGVFFALPILVLSGGGGPRIGGAPLDFSTGAAYFTLVFWAMGLFAIAIIAVAASYCSYQVVVLSDGLRASSLSGVREVRFSDIERVELIEYRLPRWMLYVALLARNPSLAGLTMDVQSGISIRLKNGEMWRLWLRGLIGEERLLPALRAGGVTIAPELEELVGQDAGEASGEDASPSPRRWLIQAIFGALTVVFCVWLYSWLGEPPPVHRPPIETALPSAVILREQSRLMGEMDKVQKALASVVQRMQKARPEESDGLMREAEDLKKKFDELHEEFQALSKPKAAPKPEDRGHNPG
ncbi:MAG: hypothetical protein AB1696_00170 [Planctomycetota bacterium]